MRRRVEEDSVRHLICLFVGHTFFTFCLRLLTSHISNSKFQMPSMAPREQFLSWQSGSEADKMLWQIQVQIQKPMRIHWHVIVFARCKQTCKTFNCCANVCWKVLKNVSARDTHHVLNYLLGKQRQKGLFSHCNRSLQFATGTLGEKCVHFVGLW